VASLGDRFRRAAAGVADTLGLRRSGTALVPVGRPKPLPPPPAARPRRALPAPRYPVCRACGHRHPPPPGPAAAGGLGAYSRTLLPDPNRPGWLGRGPADERPLLRDQVSAWRHGTPDPPPAADPRLAELREDLRTPST
jgi:hypothetical protein